MSHTTTGKTQCKITQNSKAILEASCKALGYKLLPWGKHKLYSTTEEGFGVEMPGWRYPVILNENGHAKDNYNGSWGKESCLEKLEQRIVTETIKQESARLGHSVHESVIDGKIKLEISIEGDN